MSAQIPPKPDRDDIILRTLDNFPGNVSPKILSRECQKQGLPRASYFRRLRKLKKIRLIEENLLLTEDGETKKVYNRIPGDSLADPRAFAQYLLEMKSSDKDIRDRGFRDFGRLCSNKRTAWYFSSDYSPRFKDAKMVKDFFEERLLHGTNQMVWLRFLNDIVRMETLGSFWKRDLYESCGHILWRIAWKNQDFKARHNSIVLLRRFRQAREEVLRWAFQMVEEDSSSEDFVRLRDDIRSILFDVEGRDHRYSIRERLNELSLNSGKLRKRINYILQNAPL